MYLRIALTLASVLLFSGRAAAESERIRILYRADDGCPSESAFQHEVLGRTSIARISADATSVRVFEVELLRSGPRVVGSLVIHERDGATVARRFTGRNCRDVAKVLALATALAVDPRAELAPSEPSSEEPPSPKPAANGTRQQTTHARGQPPAASTSDAADTSDAPSALDAEPTDVPVAERAAAARATAALWRRHASLGARAAFGVGPRPAFGATFTIGAFQTSGNLPWTIALGAVWLDALPTELKGAEAKFTFLAGRPQLCAQVFHPVQPLTISPCIAAELGVVTAAGSNLPRAETHHQFWATAEALLRFQLVLSGDWFLAVDSGVALPLTRYQYIFSEPETSIYATPIVAFGLTLSAGVQF